MIPAHHVDCWSTEVQPIFITKIIHFSLVSVHTQRTPLHAGLEIIAATAHAHTKISARNGIKQASIYLCFRLNVGRCLHAFRCFFRRANLHAWVVCWGFLQGAQLFIFSSCKCFLCWCGQ
ncbi:hypothetical protein TCDM_12375 [Trypanosoma cruzi Dm28c]|uniref:Uncharacterized protein n=1 Tax=Trypanosoma cruzi Dm28c TaxID=1416333 RepID=V5ADC8_TRYCR|nr:hypothetical protein TCDM_12375 [Trypanosoma cruzi Dm28c]